MKTKILLALCAVWACLSAAAPQKSVLDSIMGNREFDAFLSLMRIEGDIIYDLTGDGPYTLLVPTDAALAKMPKRQMHMLKKDKAMLRRFLLNHVVTGRHDAAELVRMGSIKTWAGKTINLRNVGGKGMVGDNIKFVNTNVVCSNGIYHSIDGYLMP